MEIRKSNVEKYKTFYIMLLIILTSGSVIFYKMYYTETLILLFVSSILLFFPQKFESKSLLIYVVLLMAIMCNYIFHQENLSSYIGLILKLTAIFLIIGRLNFTLALNYYVKIIYFLAFTSIPFFLAGLLYPDLIRNLIPVTYVWEGMYRISPLYVYQYWTLARNNSIFWEPGAYQIFLNLALLICLKIRMDKYKLYVFVITLTIFTTFSTAGYIIAATIYILFYSKEIFKNYKAIVPLIIVIILSVGVEYKWGVIGNKFSEDNSSFNRRSLDTTSNLELMVERPIVGWGYQNNLVLDINYGIKDSSNSLLQFGYQFGLTCFILLLSYYFIQIRSTSKSIFESIILWFIFLFMLSTQNIIFQPLFLIVFFITSILRKKRYINKMNYSQKVT